MKTNFPVPMETESTRTRLTLIKKVANSNETCKQDDHNNCEQDEDILDIKFLRSITNKNKDIDFSPYILVIHPYSMKQVNVLVDTGANKNILKSGIIPLIQPTYTIVKNISGSHDVTQKGIINLLGGNLPEQLFYEMDFHAFFDGLIGSEYLAMCEGTVDYKNEVIHLLDKTFPFHKYFPTKKYYHHIVSIETQQNGD